MRLRFPFFGLLLFILLPGFGTTALSQTSPLRFAKYGVKDGLSASIVNCVLKDSYGFLWVGTNNGLNRFDGYRTKVFEHDPSRSNSLLSNRILSLSEDHDKNLWIGTTTGLCVKRNGNTGFDAINLASENVQAHSINALLTTKKGEVFVATELGFFILKDGNKQPIFIGAKHSQNDLGRVNSFAEDPQGMVWIGSSNN
ncbi:MAG TPA: two-component regulator propeller domain-containing protein, partial [Sunxiuqinia sp.]|nr:two-component regulator propeller domain-containing protein [Sunxiuqinia sp.]